ncbi:MAG: hypothetical protein V1726_06770 [Methanobacteriota archaeon]
MRKIVIISIFLLLLSTAVILPTAATPPDQGEVDLLLLGGVGVHGIVINNQNNTLHGKLVITNDYGNTTLTFTVPKQRNVIVNSFPFGIYRPITVTLTVGSQKLEKIGFVYLGFFVFLV